MRAYSFTVYFMLFNCSPSFDLEKLLTVTLASKLWTPVKINTGIIIFCWSKSDLSVAAGHQFQIAYVFFNLHFILITLKMQSFPKSLSLPWSATYGKVTLPWIFYAVHYGANNQMWIPFEHLQIHAGKSH